MAHARRLRPRRLAIAIAAGVLATAAAPAAQPGPEPTRQPPPPPGAPLIDRSDPLAPAVLPSSGQPLPAPEVGSVMRRPEHLSHKPSGFWTSNRPAEGGAYRWRIMAMGGLFLAGAIVLVVILLRRANRERALAGR